ncbi:MAG: putative zinc-binding peptidase [Planctomycetota bacterium]|nr:putative zinc-binding metallopeptidase [Planctomycetaceae bacterium]MDQ3333069.1 putative zinc-binding peptidase [Planctomycetota bacterium]
MRTYTCLCGATTFFDNTRCLTCGREQGFCPKCRTLSALLPQPDFSYRCGTCDAPVGKCWNYSANSVCNRCVSPPTEGALCDCCRFNATIPDLSVSGNAAKWYRLEAAKRRLFYDLDLLGLPYGTSSDGIDPPLAFDFKADYIPVDDFWRPTGDEEQVYTGHANGRITINVREADDVEREKLRVDMGEAHRTLIGHFRHEIGHYYWDMLVKDRREDEFKALFGDHENPAYNDAMNAYYQSGPAYDWPSRCVSAYASMHPWEDFAETWARYLAMISALDTARHAGFETETDSTRDSIDTLVARYQRLGIALNEINRSMGLIDVVPDVFVPAVVEKLRYIDGLVREARENNQVFRSVAALG